MDALETNANLDTTAMFKDISARVSRKSLLKKMSGDAVFFPEMLAPHYFGITHLFIGATVALLQGISRPIKILEIGSWIGSSALTWASAIDEFIEKKGSLLCVDPWLPYLRREEVEKAAADHTHRLMDRGADTGLAYEVFLHNINYAPKGVQIDHFRGVSKRVLPYLQDGSFDIVYIDGSHEYEDVMFDIKEADRLVGEGGIVCGDDLQRQYHLLEKGQAEKHINSDVAEDPKTGILYHPGVTMAVLESMGPVADYYGYWLMKKTSRGYAPPPVLSEAVFPSYLTEEEKVAWLEHFSAAQSPK